MDKTISGSTPCTNLLSKRVQEVDLQLKSLQVLEGKEKVVSEMCKQLTGDFHKLKSGLEYLRKVAATQKQQMSDLKEYSVNLDQTNKSIDYIMCNIPNHFICTVQATINEKIADDNSNDCDSDSLDEGINSLSVERVDYNHYEDQVTPRVAREIKPKPDVVTYCPTVAFLTRAEFDGMSSYMRGSSNLTYDAVNIFISSFNTALLSKYKLLAMPKNKIQERLLHNRYKKEESKDTKGVYFITEEDLKNTGQMKAYKTTQSLLSILRSFQRMREIRGQGFVRYAVVHN